MRIGTIGSGTMGRCLGKLWANVGHNVLFGSRDPQRVADWIKTNGIEARSGTYAEAASFGDVVLLATLWPDTKSAVESSGSLEGKTLIDCTNPEDPNNNYQHVIGFNTSGAEEIAKWASGAKLVKAFNHVYGSMLEMSPQFDSHNATIFYCGDDPTAKNVVSELALGIGLDPVDAGDLRSARFLEPLAALWVQLAHGMELGPSDIGLKLLRRDPHRSVMK